LSAFKKRKKLQKVNYIARSASLIIISCFFIIYAGIAILLALSFYQTIVNEKLPSTSDVVPLMGKEYCYLSTSFVDDDDQNKISYKTM